MAGSDDGGMAGVLLIAVGVVAVVGSLVGGLWVMGGVGGSDYTHSLEPDDETRCTTSRPAAEQYRYGELSAAGQTLVDRAMAEPGSTVTTDDPVPAFEYGTALDTADPQYVRADAECFRLRAEQSGIGEPGVIIEVSVFGVLGLVAVLGLVTAAVGTVKYGD